MAFQKKLLVKLFWTKLKKILIMRLIPTIKVLEFLTGEHFECNGY